MIALIFCDLDFAREPGPNHSIFPMDNCDLVNARWEDEVIWDSQNMEKIPGWWSNTFFSHQSISINCYDSNCGKHGDGGRTAPICSFALWPTIVLLAMAIATVLRNQHRVAFISTWIFAEPKVLTLDFWDDPKIFGMPEDKAMDSDFHPSDSATSTNAQGDTPTKVFDRKVFLLSISFLILIWAF